MSDDRKSLLQQADTHSRISRRSSEPLMMQKPSTGKSLQAVANNIRRKSHAVLRWTALTKSKLTRIGEKKPAMENTYKMNQEQEEHFMPDAVKLKIEDILKETLLNREYSFATSKGLTCRIADEVKEAVKDIMISKRHKLVCHVVLGADQGQLVHSVSRCVWNTESDSMATATYNTGSMFAVCSLYAVYFE